MSSKKEHAIEELIKTKRYLENLRQEILNDIEFRVREKFRFVNGNLPYEPDIEERKAAIRYYAELASMRLKELVEIEEKIRILEWKWRNLEVSDENVES